MGREEEKMEKGRGAGEQRRRRGDRRGETLEKEEE